MSQQKEQQTDLESLSSTSLLLSCKNIPPEDRLIFALDVATNEEAKNLVKDLGDTVTFYKLGLQLFMGGEYLDLLEWLVAQGKKVFVDLKFFDVPQTVKSAVQGLAKYGATFATVHGNDEILKAAVSVKGDMKILSVTALTSLDQGDMHDLGFAVDIKQLVLSRAKRALAIGCDGVISSGLEVAELRSHLATQQDSKSFLVVTPGVRPVDNVDDQKRTVNVEQAFYNGADYIVVGRPIREHHGFSSPQEAAANIQQKITQLFTT